MDWTLWRLWEVARSSFYFAPSMWLWETYPRTREDGPDLEIDALAVVDGQLYLCEAKSSSGLDNQQIEQLFSAATHVRPDVLLIACRDEVTPGLKASAETLRSRLGAKIKVELLEFHANALEKNSILPA
jgi:hypothetical protein